MAGNKVVELALILQIPVMYCFVPLSWEEYWHKLDYMADPPFYDQSSNPVNFSMLITDFEHYDEAEGKFTIRADIAVTWRDERWYPLYMTYSYHDILQVCQKLDPASMHACKSNMSLWTERFTRMNKMLFAENMETFEQRTADLLGILGYSNQSAKRPAWNPVSKHLKQHDALAKTRVQPYVYLPFSDVTLSHQCAGFLDTDTTSFDVTAEYTYFPFDTQTLFLTFEHDFFSLPRFEFDAIYGHPEPESAVNSHLEIVKRRSGSFDDASSVSRLVSQNAQDKLSRSGWTLLSAEPYLQRKGFSTHVGIKLIIRRKLDVILLRFFGPMMMLVFTSFAGFWFPGSLAMPRVATGFISFLSLQVFRSIASSLIPKKTYTLLWMDVEMFVVSEILFGAVLENIAAQFLRQNVSTHTANHLDKIARWSFPSVTLVVLGTIFGMGSAQIAPGVVMAASQCVLFALLILLLIKMRAFVRHLPQMLMKLFVDSGNALASGKYKRLVAMDKTEMALLFSYIDSSQTGFATPEELVSAFEQHGLIFGSTTAREEYKRKLQVLAEESGHDEFDVDGFCDGFPKFLKSMRRAGKKQIAVRPTPASNGKEVEDDTHDKDEDDQSVVGM